MSDERRCIELAVEVPGSPEEVWRAIATGAGISSWYVPHTIEEREGGGATASFGPEPEMQIQGRVAAWEPPHRVVFDGGEGVEGMAFEWTIDARDGGTCIVGLVNSGFGRGDEWDALYDDMPAGWQLFMLNLRLHLQHFRGRTAVASLPTAACSGTLEGAWTSLTGALGIPPAPAVGDQVKVTALDAPALAGTVADVAQHRVALLLDQPSPGIAFITVHRQEGAATAAIWSYLYGDQAAAAAERDERLWREWLNQLTPQEGCEPPTAT